MIKPERHRRILDRLHAEGVVQLAGLAAEMPEVSRVTLRRDIAELADAGALERTHGGATLPGSNVLNYPAGRTRPDGGAGLLQGALDRLDAVILPPIGGRGAEALRRQIARRGLPLIAESAPQDGGAYLGPDNARAGLELGRLAGERARPEGVRALIIAHARLPNTEARADGFIAGLRETSPGPVRIVRVDGQGNYRTAIRVAEDAVGAVPPDIVFGVNDHSAQAGLDATERAGLDVEVYAAGGERADFIGRLAEDGPLQGVAAFFPEVVGARAIDALAEGLATGFPPQLSPTPHAILTPGTVATHYSAGAEGWTLRPETAAALIGRAAPRRVTRRRRVGFMPHFPAHDWYRTMIPAMDARARAAGLDLVVSPPDAEIEAEIARLRLSVGARAAALVRSGETIILGEGAATQGMAEALARRAASGALADLTVVTNALDVLSALEGAPGIRVLLTSGEYQRNGNCLVGPSLGALFERMRGDVAYLSTAGITARFGLSATDERLALAGTRLAGAAHRCVALADHTAIGGDATYRVTRIEDVDAVVTDDGALPADRQSLREAGVEVLIADATEDGRNARMPRAQDA
ncbi:MAG: substrate-binding domain-containing protein [Pseudomonadota bacterium]